MKKLFLAATCAGLLALVFLVGPAHAGTLTVCEVGCDHVTIQAAVDAAVAGDVIQVQVEGEHTEANITIDKNLTVAGLGADVTFVQAAATACAVEGRVFSISAGSVVLEDMAIRNGCVPDTFAGGHPGQGGGIWSAATLELRSTYVTSNTVKSDAAGTVSGAGIYSTGSLVVRSSTLAGNEARSATGIAAGGGLYNNGAARVGNSTFSGNSATSGGGGIHNVTELALFNVTVADNETSNAIGDGLNNAGQLSIENSLLVNNNSETVGSEDCFTSGLAAVWDLGHNLVMVNNCGLPEVRRPEVGLLADNGGPTLTHALLSGSPAIDGGECSNDMHLIGQQDQRGVLRPQGGGCDIGAFERPTLLFPIIYRNLPIYGPDLIPIELTVEPSTGLSLSSDVVLTVVLKNDGNEATTPDNFWVDLYINPIRPPETAGEIWCDLCLTPGCVNDLGLAWHVTGVSLEPNGELTLSSEVGVDPYLVPSQTHWNGNFIRPGDQELYFYVDSWGGEGVVTGWIDELDETNNRLGPVSVNVSDQGMAGIASDTFDPMSERRPEPTE